MLCQNALLALRNSDLEEQLAVLNKRKTCKRKYIQHSRTLEFGAAAEQVAQTASTVVNPQRRLCSGSALKTLSTKRRCGKCGEPEHNARTCKKDALKSSESDCTTAHEFSGSSVRDNDHSK
jgi:uncharacterized low-complexity protein